LLAIAIYNDNVCITGFLFCIIVLLHRVGVDLNMEMRRGEEDEKRRR